MYGKKKAILLGIIIIFFCFLLAVVFYADRAIEYYHMEKRVQKEILELVEVSDNAKKLFRLKNPYIENESKQKELLSALGMEKFGTYTIETKTEQGNSALILHFKKKPEDPDKFNSEMIGYANLLLALIDNAAELDWTYPTEESLSMNEEGLEAFVAWKTQEAELVLNVKSIKEYGESEEKVQELLDRCGF